MDRQSRGGVAMPIPISARATLKLGDGAEQHHGTLGGHMLRYLALTQGQRRRCTMTVLAVVELPDWSGPRTYLDAEALRDLAREMEARGLI